MKKAVIKGVVIGSVFLIALFVISRVANKGNNDLTVEMAKATYPLVYMEKEGDIYNCLHGYKTAMDTGFERNTITVLDEGRGTGIVVEKFGRQLDKLGFEVRSVDGGRLIEDGELTEYEEREDKLFFQLALKDLIEPEQEYCLVLLLNPDGKETIRYYTRVVWSEKYFVKEKLDFVRDFHEKTFEKEAGPELRKYLESNSEGDNSSFYKVNIHSSLSQVMWGELNVEKLSETIQDIKDITAQTASILQNYYVATGSGKDRRYYRVEEYYRIRYTTERTYLLDFERKMEQILQIEDVSFSENLLNLGIVNPDFQFVESEDGNILVFENQGRLFSYNVTDNKFSVLFRFFDSTYHDARVMYQKHRIQVLNVDEAGNIQFAVYGYMNRGRHEGNVGIQIYYYNSTLNTVEEAVYIPYDKSADVLMQELEMLLYMNRDNSVFFMLEGSVYGVDLQKKSFEVLVSDVNDGALQVSKSGKMVVWQESQDLYNCEELLLMDLSTGRKMQLDTRSGDYILPLGFIEEDLVYGLAKKSELTKDSAGRTIFPMYVVYIQNANGEVLKKYQQDHIYVTGCTINENQITLKRASRDEEGQYLPVADDQIMNSEAGEAGKNTVDIINAGEYEKQVRIAFKENVNTKGLKVLTPREVLFEGGRELELSQMESRKERYYVYGPEGVEGIYMNPANAVNLAYTRSGVVTDDTGHYVFRKGNRVARNQIMAISGEAATQEKSSVTVCLDTMLGLEGVVRNTQMQVSQGESPYEILKSGLAEYQILDLTGCPLDAVLYYVNQDIPVMALMRDGNAVLVVGFNEVQIVVMDPMTGTLYKRGMKDAAEWFEQNGNYFVTYVK